MIKKILVGLSGNEYTIGAVNQAVAIAMARNAEITGVSVVDDDRLSYVGPIPLGGAEYAKDLIEGRKAKVKERTDWAINEFKEACAASGVRHKVVREVGDPFSVFIDFSRYHDLMIFGLRSIFEHEVVDEPHDALVQLIQSGVRPLIATSQGFYATKRVLISYSGSTESAKAMKQFIQMSIWPDAQIRIVTFDDRNSNVRQLLRDAADYCEEHGYKVETEAVTGSPKNQLLKYSEAWGADLTVAGNSAKNLFVRKVFGETALNLIRNATRPLFLSQ